MQLFSCESGDSRAAARHLLTLALRNEYGIEVLPRLAYGPHGKPFFPDYPHIHFNVSHSGPYALCALGDSPVGVDIESVRPRSPRLPRYALSPQEYRRYTENGGNWAEFYVLWTRKESWCKYRGIGLARPAQLCPPLPGAESGGPMVTGLAGDGWRGAVCTDSPLESLRRLVF